MTDTGNSSELSERVRLFISVFFFYLLSKVEPNNLFFSTTRFSWRRSGSFPSENRYRLLHVLFTYRKRRLTQWPTLATASDNQMREREREGQSVGGSNRRRNWGDALDGWADASSNVLPVIERRLKVGNFGVPLRCRLLLAGTWTSPHDVSWTRSWLNRAAKGNICRRNVCMIFRTVYDIRTNERRVWNIRRRFKMHNLSLLNGQVRRLDQFYSYLREF